eukprot:1371050-Rhodomonas_salina.1
MPLPWTSVGTVPPLGTERSVQVAEATSYECRSLYFWFASHPHAHHASATRIPTAPNAPYRTEKRKDSTVPTRQSSPSSSLLQPYEESTRYLLPHSPSPQRPPCK